MPAIMNDNHTFELAYRAADLQTLPGFVVLEGFLLVHCHGRSKEAEESRANSQPSCDISGFICSRYIKRGICVSRNDENS